jgi:hypothetical protein
VHTRSEYRENPTDAVIKFYGLLVVGVLVAQGKLRSLDERYVDLLLNS